jgi:hypothetical protein
MLAQAVAYLPKMRELSSSCLYLLSWLLSVKVDSICLRISLVVCTFFWLLLAKFTDVPLPPVILASSWLKAFGASAAQILQRLMLFAAV